jgi:DNA-binding NarL/FixJ family response regulator
VEEFQRLDAAASRKSDIVLLDLTLKDGSAPAVNVGKLKDAGYWVVIYTGEERAERLQCALGIGADALVRKEEADALEAALHAVAAGSESWISPLMAEVALAHPHPDFSPTQVEVLQLFATGLGAKQIARIRRCSEATIDSYLKEVKSRYQAQGDDVHTKTDLLRVGLRDGYIAPDWFARRR